MKEPTFEAKCLLARMPNPPAKTPDFGPDRPARWWAAACFGVAVTTAILITLNYAGPLGAFAVILVTLGLVARG